MKFQYTNHRGVKETRDVKPLALTLLEDPASVNKHLEGYKPGIFLEAYDNNRGAKRHFRIGSLSDRFVPVSGFPIEIGDLAEIKKGVDNLAAHATKQTSDEVSAIAAQYMDHEDPNVRALAATALGQDQIKGKRPKPTKKAPAKKAAKK